MSRSIDSISSTDFVKALQAAGPFSEHELKLFRFHYSAEGHTATARELADKVGWKSFASVNAHYGKLAGRVARELGIEPDYNILALVTTDQPHGSECRFILRPAVVEALRRLAIV
ncbi:MAG: hypothetical protein K1X67_20875 [Fimbriimonadaceae bacterium]|nr:hypothetical protein [Fimbriimonadaceae bacterium]